MDPARIAELLQPFLVSGSSEKKGAQESITLSAPRLKSISIYIDMLLRWNSRINLTAIRGPEEIVTRHFGESLFAARCLFPHKNHAMSASINPFFGLSGTNRVGTAASEASDNLSLADVGSGAGFPGIPIKLWAPEVSVTLIESSHRKAAFLRECVRSLTLTNINIQNVRAETLPPASYDIVTLRAVERFEKILPIAAALVAPSGRLALLIGSAQLDLARQTLADHSWLDPIPIPSSRSRILAIAAR